MKTHDFKRHGSKQVGSMGMRILFPASLLAGLMILGSGGALAQSLSAERLNGLPSRLNFGAGTVRLDGMGGFEASVADENLQINLNDFSLNPAGYGDDKESWIVELRYGHQELTERDPRTPGNDIFVNEGAFQGGYYRPGKFGAGAQINFADVNTRTANFGDDTNAFEIMAARFVANAYVLPSLTVGADFIFSGESEEVGTSSLYNINHEASTMRGALGVAWIPLEGITLGAKGQIISSSVEGTSSGDFHTDTFDWSRPGGQVSLHGFIDRSIVKLGVDYRREEINGDESVRISWSEKFIFNPGPESVTGTLNTFSEKRETDVFRARLMVDVTSSLALSAATTIGSEAVDVKSNPNAIGSRVAHELSSDVTTFPGGASWKLLESRLLVAAEVKVSSSDSDLLFEEETFTGTLDATTFRLGGEYFLGEAIMGRLGLVLRNDDFVNSVEEDLNGSYATTKLAVGLGIVPKGGILRVDLALDTVLDSDLDNKETAVSGYIRQLF